MVSQIVLHAFHSAVNSADCSVEMEPGTIGWSRQASCQTKRCWPKTVESLAVPRGCRIASGHLTFCHRKSPCLMGKSTISTGPFSIAFCMFTRPGSPKVAALKNIFGRQGRAQVVVVLDARKH